MFSSAVCLEGFVVGHLPKPRDALALIGSLELLNGCLWERAGLTPELLCMEMRRQGYQRDMSQRFVVKCVSLNRRGDLKLSFSVLRQNDDNRSRAEKMRLLWDQIWDYRKRATVQGDEYYFSLVRMRRLPPLVVNHVMSYLLVTANEKTGPLVYCMRCKQWLHLHQYIHHVANSQVHVSAALGN